MKRILVTGAGGSAGGNFIASLRLADEPFYIVGTDMKPYHLELAAVDARYLVPPASHPDYIGRLNEAAARERVDLVHPQPDVEVAVVSEARERVASPTFLPAKETIRLCQDKWALIERLAARGVPTARSYLVRDLASLREALNFLLPQTGTAWVRATRGAGSKAALPVTSLDHAAMWIDYWRVTHGVGFGAFMVSEYLPGKEFAFQSLWRNGEIVTSQARERIEYLFGSFRPSGQSSSPSVARTVWRDDVNTVATQAVRAVDPHATGIFCIDLRENAQGVPCVMEINAGRFFTTSNFLAEAGSNMPYYHVLMALGEPLPPLPPYNAVPENWYWVRMVDMGYKLVKGDAWMARDASVRVPAEG